MKLMAIEESQLVALLRVSQLEGPLPLLTLINSIRKEFQFSHAPETLKEISADGLKFAHGSFDGAAIDSLTMHDDGVVIVSRSSTEFLDRVFERITSLAQNEYGFELIKTHKIDKFYRSALIISTDKKILGALNTYDQIRASFEKALLRDSGIKAHYEPFGISFANDPQKSVVKPSAFRIERKSGTDFDYNHYFCEAPLKTQTHVKILTELETLC